MSDGVYNAKGEEKEGRGQAVRLSPFNGRSRSVSQKKVLFLLGLSHHPTSSLPLPAVGNQRISSSKRGRS